MLVLSRHRDESIMLGDDIAITVVEIRGDKVRLGFDAPMELPIHRKEVYDAIKSGGEFTPRQKSPVNDKITAKTKSGQLNKIVVGLGYELCSRDAATDQFDFTEFRWVPKSKPTPELDCALYRRSV